MLRNINLAQKSAREFYKSDVLAQTNQIKYDCFFSRGTENKKIFFSRSKTRNKNPGHGF